MDDDRTPLDRARDEVERNGFTVVVLGDTAHTIGLHLRGLPELIARTPHPPVLLLYRLREIVERNGRAFRDGEHVATGMDGPSVVKIIDAIGPVRGHMILASIILDTRNYSVQEVVLNDAERALDESIDTLAATPSEMIH